MDNAIEKEDVIVIESEKLITLSDIKNKIYEIRGVQVMLDSKVSVPKRHDCLYNKIVKHYDIGLPISMLINFADEFLESERS